MVHVLRSALSNMINHQVQPMSQMVKEILISIHHRQYYLLLRKHQHHRRIKKLNIYIHSMMTFDIFLRYMNLLLQHKLLYKIPSIISRSICLNSVITKIYGVQIKYENQNEITLMYLIRLVSYSWPYVRNSSLKIHH